MSDDKDQDNDLPLDDDIIDGDFTDSADDAAPVDEEFDDESWESYDEEPMGDSPAIEPQPKKKSSNTLIIGITVAIALGVFVMQLAGGGGKKNPKPQQQAEAPAAAPVAPPVDVAAATAPEQPAPQATGGAFDNPAALDNIVKNKSGNEVDVIPPMPTPIQTETAAAPNDVLTPLPQDLPAAALPPATPNAPRPPQDAEVSAPPVVAASPNLPRMADVLLPTQGVPVATPVAGSQDMAKVSEKLDQLFTRLEQIEKKVDEKSALPAGSASVAVDGDVARQIDDLKNTISKLNDRLSGMEAQTRIVAEKAEEAVSVAASAKRAPAQPAAEEKTAQASPQADETPAPVKKKVPAKKAKPAAPKTTDEKPAQAVAPSWVLKGAMPGKAMLSKPGQSEVFTVGVGDTLPGVGRVTGVYVDAGKWVVETTGGRIAQ